MPNGSIAAGPVASARHSAAQVTAVGALGGALSGLLGVGGGVIMVPLLVLWLGVDQRSAHAASLGAIIPISIAGIASYGLAGEVDVAAAVALAVGAGVGARAGAQLLADLDPHRLKVVFGAFLVRVALSLVVF